MSLKFVIIIMVLCIITACSKESPIEINNETYCYRICSEGEVYVMPIYGKLKETDSLVFQNFYTFLEPHYYDELSELENFIDSLSKEGIVLFYPVELSPSMSDVKFISQYSYYKINKLTLEEESIFVEQIIKINM